MGRNYEKPLSPGRLTARRFFRNPLSLVGLGILVFLFLLSFLGGAISPYRQDQVFYREDVQQKTYAAITENTRYRFTPTQFHTTDAVLEAHLTLALSNGQETIDLGDRQIRLERQGQDLYGIYDGDTLWGIAHKDLIIQGATVDFPLLHSALIAYTNADTDFGESYRIDREGQVYQGNTPIFRLGRRLVRPAAGDSPLPTEFSRAAESALDQGQAGFTWEGRDFSLRYETGGDYWIATEQTLTRVWDAYAAPSQKHLLGTDKNGMDVLTRLMYGGRVSLVIGFIVIAIAGLLGVLFGGISGYFGGWADEAVMRLVDIFYCIPATPMLIILGAAMDAMRVDPSLRMLLLMLVLGFLGWPEIARLVRGQILSLREQEFMTAAEAAGLGAGRRIFRHLIPNVIPQLIVTCTMRLGSAILTEATLSFLGLGVKFPFASWGNIMNDVGNVHVLTSYWFVWIPAGVCLVLAVLGFHFVGDGLRDAFDPKTKG